MKKNKTTIIVLIIFSILSNAAGTYLFYYLGMVEHMDLLPPRQVVSLFQAFSPIIFNLHRSIWGVARPGTWEYIQLAFSGIEFLALILFIMGIRRTGWFLFLCYIMTAMVGIAHLLYFVYFGIETPSFIFPGRDFATNIHVTARIYLLTIGILIVSRIIWVTVSIIVSWQIRQVLKYGSKKNYLGKRELSLKN